MDFALGAEAGAVFDMARAFGQDRIAPHAQAWEEAGEIPKSLWPEIAELGFGGLYVAEGSGGSGLSRLEATLVFEALSMAVASVADYRECPRLDAPATPERVLMAVDRLRRGVS